MLYILYMENEKSLGTFVTQVTQVDKVQIGNWTIEKSELDDNLIFAYKGIFQFIMKPDTHPSN